MNKVTAMVTQTLLQLGLISIEIIIIIIQMDFLIDQRFFKSLKPLGLSVLAIATAFTLAYAYNKFSEDDEDEEITLNLDQKKQQKRPAGIMNQGNTCFVNSLLQALASLKIFIKNIDELLEGADPRRMNINERLLYEMKSALEKINQGNDNQSIDVGSLLGVLQSFSNLINFEQQDAHELYTTIVSCFESVNNQRKSISLNSSSFLTQPMGQQKPPLFWEQSLINGCPIQGLSQNSLVGYMRSSIKCASCKIEKNIKIHPFYHLSLEIAPMEIHSLHQALLMSQSTEVISGYNCVYCSIQEHISKLKSAIGHLRKGLTEKSKQQEQNQKLSEMAVEILAYLENLLCRHEEMEMEGVNQHLEEFVLYKDYDRIISTYGLESHPRLKEIYSQVGTIKRTIFKVNLISKYPKILVLHLKQLSINPYSGAPVLLRKQIDFPEIFKINTRNGVKNYQLTSLLSHIGSESMGHYFTFRRLSGSDRQWFVISDTFTRQCGWESLQRSIPYMLFYELDQRDFQAIGKNLHVQEVNMKKSLSSLQDPPNKIVQKIETKAQNNKEIHISQKQQQTEEQPKAQINFTESNSLVRNVHQN